MKKLALFLVLLVSIWTVEQDYTDFVKSLQQKIQQSPYKHSAYERLAYIVDTYGTRMWGSISLEQVIHEMMSQASTEGFENIRLEAVSNFTKWVRGKESLTLMDPRPTPSSLEVIGLGGSVAGYFFIHISEMLRLKL
jgi:hypothetical protein